jgi:O-methyltransferase
MARPYKFAKLLNFKRYICPPVKRTIRKANALLKGIVLWLRPGLFLGFLSSPFLFASNLLSLSRWISKQERNNKFNDFFTLLRDRNKRYKLYEHVCATEELKGQPIDYLEFGVSGGFSFRWWLQNNTNVASRFYGFDTFEGLPEDWGTYNKGDMSAVIPDVNDPRCEFLKGLFQDTLNPFLTSHPRTGNRKVIHLDADLYSSTLFVLTTLAKDLHSGDILLFDEFNVPNHEWMAYQAFTKSFYIKTELIGAVNNYFQVAFKVL